MVEHFKGKNRKGGAKGKRGAAEGPERRIARAPAPGKTWASGPRMGKVSSPPMRLPEGEAERVRAERERRRAPLAEDEAEAPAPRETVSAPQEPERVAKRLARAGVASRRDVERLIGEGRVALNGEVLDSPARNVGPEDVLTLDGAPVGAAEVTRLFRLHKPVGVLTTNRDPQGRATVFDDLPREMPRVVTVGRLDINSEGLLLLTNDGALARALELPSSGWVRRYRARAYGRVNQARLDRLKDGVEVEGVRYGAIEAKLDKATGDDEQAPRNVWISVAITEGKNREVRRVLEHLGLKVNRLLRLAYGPFQLGDLPEGGVAEVGPRVIRELLADYVAPESMPRGDAVQLQDYAPAPGRRGGGAPRSGGAARPGAPRPGGPARGPRPAAGGARAAGPRPPRTGVSQGAEEGGRPAYKPGWAKPKGKPGHAGPPRSSSGPRRDDGPRPDRAQSGRPQGDRPRFDGPREDRPRGDGPRQARPRSDGPRPPRPFSERAQGDRPQGGRPQGDRPQGARPAGQRSFGDRQPGDRAFGDRPRSGPRSAGAGAGQGDRPRFDGPRGDRKPTGDRPGGKPYGKPGEAGGGRPGFKPAGAGGPPRSGGPRPAGPRPGGSRPSGSRPGGGRPGGGKPRG